MNKRVEELQESLALLINSKNDTSTILQGLCSLVYEKKNCASLDDKTKQNVVYCFKHDDNGKAFCFLEGEYKSNLSLRMRAKTLSNIKKHKERLDEVEALIKETLLKIKEVEANLNT